MKPGILLIAFVLLVSGFNASFAQGTEADDGVQIVNREDKKRVDVFIDGAQFTSYLFAEAGSSLKKPILYPLRTPSGIDITRGYPFEKRAGERVDHPHHVGHWFNYGDVDGIDFWNNSDAISEERRPHMGTIVHRAVKNVESGKEKGMLDVEMDWLHPDSTVMLTEATRFVFRKAADRRVVDRITTLKAVNGPVSFPDNKEGVIAIRVTRALELPDRNPVLLTDENGQPRSEEEVNNDGVTGNYLSSEGVRGARVWGTRGAWMMLSGVVQEEPVTVAIIDHPDNPGYPTYWHARGYGLFAANPLGQEPLSDGFDELNLSLNDGESVTFRYRIAILSLSQADAKPVVESLTTEFASETP